MDRLLCASQTSVLREDHPQDSVRLPEDAVVSVEIAEYIEGHKLRLVFSDNQERIVDFEPFLSNSPNPLISRYLNIDVFRRFTIEYGDLLWNDYDLCFPIAELLEGRI